jgi:hypothetical protein
MPAAELAIWPYGEGLIIRESQGFSQLRDDCEGIDRIVNLPAKT